MLLPLVLSALLIGQADTPSPSGRWENGPPSDPSYFPIAVWLQDPKNARRFQEAGINLYVGLWRGPNEAQLKALSDAGMSVVCAQNAVGLAHKGDRTIVGWMHGDEPDNAQPVTDPKTGRRGYGGPVPPEKIVADYERLRAADPTRPILLNLGQGVANDQWKGRGTGARPDDYLTYVKGGDIVSFDVYPVAGLDRPDGAEFLWYVAKGVDRLVNWTEGRRIVWNCIEASRVSNEKAKVTPHQLRAEVWMALVHGSTGLIYFVHQFKPTFKEAALLDDEDLLPAVTAVNRQVRELAPVLNSPTIKEGVSSTSSDQNVPIDTMMKRHAGATYVFAVGMRNAPARGSFTIAGMPPVAEAEVLGEDRKVEVREGTFEDAFRPYEVHIYRLSTKTN
jgi:hypothetical protein